MKRVESIDPTHGDRYGIVSGGSWADFGGADFGGAFGEVSFQP